MTGAKPYGRLHHKKINGKRMAYIDEGHGDAIVFQHGNPTSSYLWRNVTPHLEGLGRLVACDLIGMGGSDKLDESGPGSYHYHEHRDHLFALWDQLDLGDRVTLVLHDWGGALGFDWANRHRDRVAGIAYLETIAMPMDWDHYRQTFRDPGEGRRPTLWWPRDIPIAGEPEVTVPGVHFIQEDAPDEIGTAIASFVRAIRA